MDMFTPIHEICTNLLDESADMIELLPVAHTLTGCDTTSKIGTKKMHLQQLSRETLRPEKLCC